MATKKTKTEGTKGTKGSRSSGARKPSRTKAASTSGATKSGSSRAKAGSKSSGRSGSSAKNSSRTKSTGANRSRSSGSNRAKSAASSAKSSGSGAGNDGNGGGISLPSAGDIGGVLKKAKTPAAVAGAALVGAAGGMVLARNGRRRFSPKSMISPSPLKKGLKEIESHLPGHSGPMDGLKKSLKGMPKPDAKMMEWVEDKARAVGKGGYQVAELSAQARELQKKLSD